MKKNRLYIILLTIITAAILVVLFKPVLIHPNGILFSKSVDPLKSYFNFSYYLKFDSGIRHDGINYPYGDHLQYINSHPIYVTVLKFVDQHIYSIANYGVAILNLSMILSFLLAMPFLFLILRRFKLPPWYALAAALLIGFLNPQFDRIHGHFEMVYWFFIPLFWYLLIRWREGERKILWGSLLVISGILGGFISAYYVAFYAIFLVAVFLADLWLNHRNLKVYLKHGITLLIMALIPILFVKGLVGLTDWVDDRPYNPYGFYVYHANIFSIFLPPHFPGKELIGKIINLNFQWEGRAYVGLPAVILALAIFVTAPLAWIRRKSPDWSVYFQDKTFYSYLIAGSLVLLFSMCFPFKWGFGFLLELLPPVKQFRALGRFSWIFYYIFTIYSASLFYQLFQRIKRKGYPFGAILLLISIFTLWGFDAKYNVQRATKGLLNNNDKLVNADDEFLLRFEEAGVDNHQFQAIFALPFASTCGDKLLFERGMTAFGEAMKCSYHTGLPLVQSFSPRLSFAQALSSIQMLADSAIRKTRLEDMNEKPLLLICTKQEMNEQEAWLQSKATVFWKDQYITMSTLPISVFKASHQNWLNMVEETRSWLTCENNICTDTNIQKILYNNFDDQPADFKFTGKGAIYQRRGEVEIFNDKLPVDSGLVDVSFWLYFDTRQYDMPLPTLNVWEKEGKRINTQKLNNRQVHDVYKNWVRISTQIEVQKDFRYQLIVKGKYISVDDLLIKPINSNVLIKTVSGLELFNNFPVD